MPAGHGELLKPVAVGEPITAEMWNALVAQVTASSFVSGADFSGAAGTAMAKRTHVHVREVSLTQDLGAATEGPTTARAVVMVGRGTAYKEGSQIIVVTNRDVGYEKESGEVIKVAWLPDSAEWRPIVSGDGTIDNGTPIGTTGCGCSPVDRDTASITAEDCASLVAQDVAPRYYTGVLPTDPLVLTAAFGGVHRWQWHSGCEWRTEEFTLYCRNEENDIVEGLYYVKLVLVTASTAGKSHTAAYLELVYVSGTDCGYEFVAVCPIFNSLSGNTFTVIAGQCLQHDRCTVCISPWVVTPSACFEAIRTGSSRSGKWPADIAVAFTGTGDLSSWNAFSTTLVYRETAHETTDPCDHTLVENTLDNPHINGETNVVYPGTPQYPYTAQCDINTSIFPGNKPTFFGFYQAEDAMPLPAVCPACDPEEETLPEPACLFILCTRATVPGSALSCLGSSPASPPTSRIDPNGAAALFLQFLHGSEFWGGSTKHGFGPCYPGGSVLAHIALEWEYDDNGLSGALYPNQTADNFGEARIKPTVDFTISGRLYDIDDDSTLGTFTATFTEAGTPDPATTRPNVFPCDVDHYDGDDGGADDGCEGGVLFYSPDGTTWERLPDFEDFVCPAGCEIIAPTREPDGVNDIETVMCTPIP
jgi:hypothetical protein